MATDTFFQELYKILPAYLTRKDVGKILGNIISARYLANLDALGQGPPKVNLKGRKTIYTRDGLIAWLEGRIEVKSSRIAQ